MLVRRLLRVTKVNGSITASARGAAIAGERLLWAGEWSGWARGHASPTIDSAYEQAFAPMRERWMVGGDAADKRRVSRRSAE